jgi:Flp pilus assembly protein TadD
VKRTARSHGAAPRSQGAARPQESRREPRRGLATAGDGTDRRRGRLLAAAAFALGFLAYANTLGHDFVWDDTIWLEQRLRFYRGPLDAFLEPADVPPGFPGVYRPLTAVTYLLDQLIWWRNPLGYHLSSVLLHALNCALVYALALRLGCAAAAALAGALVFAVHPVHTEAVAWVTSRVDVLAATFTILGVLAFLRWRAHPRGGSLAAVALCAFAAPASKEPGAMLPVLLVAAAVTLAPADPAPRGPGGARGRGPWLALGASALGLLAYLALRSQRRAAAEHLTGSLDLASLGHLLGAFGFYVQRSLVPVGLHAYVPEPPSGVVVGLFAAVGVGGAAALLLAPARDRGLRRFAVLWFLATLAPSLLVVVADISATAVAERYLYLPSVGLSLLLAGELSRRPRLTTAPAARAALAAGLLVLGAATVARNAVWRDEVTLWTDVAAREARFALPLMNLGVALRDAGRAEEAEAAFRRALEARGDETNARNTYINLGFLELGRERLDEAAALFARANAIGGHASAHYGLAAVERARGRAALAAGDAAEAARRFARARAELEAALAINPRHEKAHAMLASVHYHLGDYPRAVEHYRRAVELAPDTPAGRHAAEALAQLTAWMAEHGAGP